MAVITISRHFGAGGRTLGGMVAEKMGYEFLDDAVIQELSKKIGMTKESIASMEKDSSGFFSKIISNMFGRNYMERLSGEKSGHVDEILYLDKLQEVINYLASQDNVVLLGRGSQFILSGHPEAIHFLLVADYAQRMEFLERQYNLTDSQARNEILAAEKRRKHLYSKMGCSTYDDPHSYHLVLNMGRISLEEAAEQIVLLAKDKAHEPIIPSSKRKNVD